MRTEIQRSVRPRTRRMEHRMLLVDSSGLLFSLIVKRDDEDGQIDRLQLESLLSNQKTAVAKGQQ